MLPTLIASLIYNRLWYALPLVVAVSLVYGATRHEDLRTILHHSWRTAIWILCFMGVIFGIIAFMAWNL